MKREITSEDISRILQSPAIEGVSVGELFELFRQEKGLSDFAPDGICRQDPRDGSLVIFNSKRAKRPHDNRMEGEAEKPMGKPCPVCEGNTTGVVDVALLSEGVTFINKNLFPCFYAPEGGNQPRVVCSRDGQGEGPSVGLHFLQWSSSRHHLDWHNMAIEDRSVVMTRLAALEKKLLFEAGELMPPTGEWHDGKGTHGFVTVIKNYGAAVGGSLAHGHQQIGFSNLMPTGAYHNWRFLERTGRTFSAHMLESTPEELIVKDYGPVVWVVPDFMKRPYFSLLLVKNTERQFLHELSREEVTALSSGFGDCAYAIKVLLEGVGREFAYNAVVHNGPGAGLYLELFPYSQETGGFEQSGIWVCQEKPEGAALKLRGTLR